MTDKFDPKEVKKERLITATKKAKYIRLEKIYNRAVLLKDIPKNNKANINSVRIYNIDLIEKDNQIWFSHNTSSKWYYVTFQSKQEMINFWNKHILSIPKLGGK